LCSKRSPSHLYANGETGHCLDDYIHLRASIGLESEVLRSLSLISDVWEKNNYML
jgi:hypothetical protein